MMADRKRLVALVLAQCAAFAAVLILAAFTGHGPSMIKPGRTTTPSPSSSPHTSSSSSRRLASPSGVQFTVAAIATPPSGKFQNTPVVTYDAATTEKIASASRPLGSDNSASETVPAKDHGYLVCLSPPPGWKPTGDTFLFQGWTCVYLPAVTDAACELHIQGCVFAYAQGHPMTQPGGTRGSDGWGRDLVWSVLFLLAAFVGGFAAADLWHVSTIRAAAVSVLIAVVVTLVVHYALPRPARDDARPVGQPRSPRGIEGPRGQPPGGRRPDPSIRPTPDQVAVVRLMEPQEPVTKSWWNQGEPTSAAGAAAAAEVPVTPDLSSYLDSALVAQCPNCGSFRMDTDQTAPEWRFRCQECQQIWTWRPGSPWPAIQVRPRLRKRQ